MDTIVFIRELAKAHYVDSYEYLWGLLLNALFRASLLREDDSHYWRALLLGSLLCRRLSQKGDSQLQWPPQDLLQIRSTSNVSHVSIPLPSTKEEYEHLRDKYLSKIERLEGSLKLGRRRLQKLEIRKAIQGINVIVHG